MDLLQNRCEALSRRDNGLIGQYQTRPRDTAHQSIVLSRIALLLGRDIPTGMSYFTARRLVLGRDPRFVKIENKIRCNSVLFQNLTHESEELARLING